MAISHFSYERHPTFFMTNEETQEYEFVSYPLSWQRCPDCGGWFDAVFSSSDPNYKVHECNEYETILQTH